MHLLPWLLFCVNFLLVFLADAVLLLVEITPLVEPSASQCEGWRGGRYPWIGDKKGGGWHIDLPHIDEPFRKL